MGTQITLQDKLSDSFCRFKNNIALEYQGRTLTYEELDKKSSYISNYLIDRQIEKGSFIGVLLEDKLNLVIAMLGVIKAGAVFVPLSSTYPEKRLEQMLSIVEPDYILSGNNSFKQIKKTTNALEQSIKLLNIECGNFYKEKKYYEAAKDIEYSADDRIYVYFTSGTTGEPKAILGKNLSLLHFILWEVEEFNIDDSFRVSQFTNQCHDPFLRDVLVPLIAGGTICIVDSKETMLKSKSLVKWIENSKVNLIHCTVSLFKLFNVNSLSEENFRDLKYILLAGEKLSADSLKNWYEIFEDRIELVNMYGPTETTLAKLFYRIKPGDVQRENIPIGKAMKGSKVIILDENMNICRYGKGGEIYIRTPYRTFGYYKDINLTRQKFIPNPFNNDPTDVIYKTGDKGIMREDGNVEFAGRIDRQVKIRGFRVELNEIENILLKCSDIKEAVVVNKKLRSTDNLLIAYFIREKRKKLNANLVEDVRGYLSERLPDYMLPACFVELDCLPLNENNKLDYSALPDPDFAVGLDYTVPGNKIEERLSEIWSDILGIKKIGVKKGFLDIGGHSLNAMDLISRIYEEFKVNLPLSKVFENPTIEDLSLYLLKEEQVVYEGIKPVENREYYPLSSAQKRLFLLNQLSGENIVYNIPKVFIIEGKVDSKRVETSIQSLISRHEILRTAFLINNVQPVQKIYDSLDFKLSYVDITVKTGQITEPLNETVESEKEMGKGVIEQEINDFIKPFNFNSPPLMRVRLLKVNKNRYYLLIDLHHIIADAISMKILIKEFLQLYKGKELPDLNIQYKDFAVWQYKLLESEELKRQEEYWLNIFSGEIPLLNLPTDYSRPAEQKFNGNSLRFVIAKDLSKRIKDLAKDNRVTLYMVLLAAYNILLYRYTGQEDIVVGSPISGRRHGDLDNIVGMFVNTVALRNFPEGEKSFKDFLIEVKKNTVESFENQDYPFEMLVESVDRHRSNNRNPIFDTMFALQDGVNMNYLLNEEFEISNYNFNNMVSRFDITLNVIDNDDLLEVLVQYNTELFRKNTINRIVSSFTKLLVEVSENSEVKLKDVNILSGAEKRKLLIDFNKTKMIYPYDKNINQLFEIEVEKNPDNTAVVFGEEEISYRDLNNKANQLARLLIREGIDKESVVGILVNRSIEMIIGILGVLKAGGAYLPLDPKYPVERIEYMLKDSSAGVLLTENELSSDIDYNGSLIDINDQQMYRGSKSNLEIEISPDDLAYLIYTSGSTGRPKGVMVEHRGVANLKTFFKEEFGVVEEDNILQFARSSFDASVWEIFKALLNGASLCIVNDDIISSYNDFEDYLNKKNVTVATLPPTYAVNLEPGNISSLRILITAGSSPTEKMVNKWSDKVRYINAYGPSETTVCAAFWEKKRENNYSSIPIGTPITNNRIYILDGNNNLQPPGVPGEICISSVGVARGYLNRPELSKKSFVENPFVKGERMFKTGDLGRWLEDGNIEFLGRMDNQVKVRGFRIELGEIEKQLLLFPGIEDIVVVDKDDHNNDKILLAYYVSEKNILTTELRGFLLNKLPDYMIPAYFIKVEEVPLNANGKVDRKMLPEPDKNLNLKEEYEAPVNKLEEDLVKVWSDILDLPKNKIGTKTNFFELGGHSLKASIMISKIHKKLNVKISVRDVFKYPTIKGIAGYINSISVNKFIPLKKAEENRYYPLSSVQKRLYFLQKLDPENMSYNIPQVMVLDGEVDKEKIEFVLNKLIERHESLRTAFELIDGSPVQRIDDNLQISLDYFNGKESEVKLIVDSFVKPFNLNRAPLLRAGLINLAKNKNILIFDIHHIIIDGTSINIFIKEFMALYNNQKLPELRFQYKDFAVWENSPEVKRELKKQEKFWLKEFRGELPLLELPYDYYRPGEQSFTGNRISFKINRAQTRALKNLALAEKVTLFMLLLSIYNIFLAKISGQEDIIIGTSTAGRSHADLENIVGMFVDALALRNYPEKEKTFNEFLQEVKYRTLDAFANQDYNFKDLVDKVANDRDRNRNPIFDAMFVLNNEEITELEIPGLKLKPYNYTIDVAQVDLKLRGFEIGGELNFKIEYSTKLFKKETIKIFIDNFKEIIQSILKDKNQKLNNIKVSHGLISTEYIFSEDMFNEFHF